jgi:hypothetical protein
MASVLKSVYNDLKTEAGQKRENHGNGTAFSVRFGFRPARFYSLAALRRVFCTP